MTVSKLVGLQSGWLMMVLMIVGQTEAANIQLAWDPPPAQVAGYKLYYGQNSQDYSRVIDIGSQTSYTLSGLEVDQSYYITVTAYDDLGNESPFAEEVSAMVSISDSQPPEAMAPTTMTSSPSPELPRSDGDERVPQQPTSSNIQNSELFVSSVVSHLTSARIDSGEVDVDQHWRRVKFHKTFIDPVVVANATSDQQAHPAVIGIRDVDAQGFDVRLQSWDDGERSHSAEPIGYLVIERGRYTVMNGILLEADIVEPGSTDALNRITFAQRFAITPVVVTALIGDNQADVVRGRPTKIAKGGFQYRLEASSPAHAMDNSHSLAYVAWQPSSGIIDGLTFEVKRARQITPDLSQTIWFEEIFVVPPVFLADVQGPADRNTLGVRWHEKSLAGVVITIDLDETALPPTTHNAPVIGYIALREL